MMRVRNLRVRPDLLYIASGWSTLVTDVNGRITGAKQGFFAHNTRVISAERITVDGREPKVFSTADVGAHAQLSYAEIVEGESLPSRAAYLVVERFVGEGLRTRLTVLSYAGEPRAVRLCVEFSGDFADTNEVEHGERAQRGDVVASWRPDVRELRLDYVCPGLDRALAVRVETPVPVSCVERTVAVDVVVPPHGSVAVEIAAEPIVDGRRLPAPPAAFAEPDDAAARARAQLVREHVRLRSGNLDVAAAWRTAVEDLGNLPLGEPAGPAAPIAGLPIYQEVFGRDTLTASWQALLAGPTMLRDSLRLNAAYIGQRIDDWRDEEPGKLVHQARHGPTSALGLDPFQAYYGDWATIPAFLAIFGQYYGWTADLDTMRELLPTVRRILDWADRYGDLDGDGFLEYHCRSPEGVKNQGWRDSATAVVDEDGRVVDNPIATSEVQAYWYAGLRYTAPIFALLGDRAFAATLFARSTALRRRFTQAYWMPDRGSYAMALGPDKRQVRSVTSNDGHLLASGVVPVRHARAVARRLLAPDLFSGWGIRTLSAEHPAYNPFSYHRGSVWPVDAGTIGLGLARYGCWEELHRLAEGVFAAAAIFEGHRLPEVLSGLPRCDRYPQPGVYPDSCAPQAWSSSAIVALVQGMLALRPAAPLRTILVDPHLPDWLPGVTLEGVRLGSATFDLQVRRRPGGRVSVRTRGDRVAVVRWPTLFSTAIRFT